MKIVRSVCKLCGKVVTSVKKANYCPACRRVVANNRTRSFLREHPDYGRRKMREYRQRLKQGISLQPNKSEAVRQYKMLASATMQGWHLELSCENGKWSWIAENRYARLASAKQFDSIADAKKDFLEAVF